MGELLLQTENGPPQRCAHWAKRARYAATRSTSSKKCDEQLRIKSSASGSWSNRSNFLGLPLLVLLSLRIHYASLLFVVFFVKLPPWVWSEQCVHTANTSSCAQGRCCRDRGYKFKKLWRWNFDTQLSRTIVGYNKKWFNTTFFIPVRIFIAFCTGVCSLWTSLTILVLSCFFFTVSHLPLGLSASLSGYHVFFYTYYTALEYVCFIAHLSLCFIAHLSLNIT